MLHRLARVVFLAAARPPRVLTSLVHGDSTFEGHAAARGRRRAIRSRRPTPRPSRRCSARSSSTTRPIIGSPSSCGPSISPNGVHGRIYAAIGKLIERGQIANPVTLKNLFDQDGALAEIGGAQYLARLAASVVTIINAERLRPHDPRPASAARADHASARTSSTTPSATISTTPRRSRSSAAEQKLFELADDRRGRGRLPPVHATR